MTHYLMAIIFGIAANQLDSAMRLFDGGWELIARYISGVLTIFLAFIMIFKHLNPGAMRDGVLAFSGASSGVGLGIVLARCYKDLVENRKGKS